MKFNWGTGILIFLILFLLAAGFFIAFAMRQDISLVHEDYYERGVDHTDQMHIEERSAPYLDAVKTTQTESFLQLSIVDTLASGMDSVRLLLYRPSSNSLDMELSFEPTRGALAIPLEDLTLGRYILQLSWSHEGLKYEIDQTIVIE